MTENVLHTRENEVYLALKLRELYAYLESLAAVGFVEDIQTTITCNSKYDLDFGLSAVPRKTHNSYTVTLTLYRKSNNVAQHTIELGLDKPTSYLYDLTYTGHSAPCFRGRLQSDKTASFMVSILSDNTVLKLVSEGIPKSELISAYLDGFTDLMSFLNLQRS